MFVAILVTTVIVIGITVVNFMAIKRGIPSSIAIAVAVLTLLVLLFLLVPTAVVLFVLTVLFVLLVPIAVVLFVLMVLFVLVVLLVLVVLVVLTRHVGIDRRTARVRHRVCLLLLGEPRSA